MPFNWLAHSPGNFSFLRGFSPNGPQAPLGAGQAAAQADAARVASTSPRPRCAPSAGRRRSSAADSGRRLPRPPRRSCRRPRRAPPPPGRRCRPPARCRPAPGCACSAPAGAAASGRCARRYSASYSFSASRKTASCACRRSIRLAVRHRLRGNSRSATGAADTRRQISASESGCGLKQLDALAVRARQRLRLRLLHGVQQRVEQVERNHHQDARQRVGALQFPGDARGMPRDLLRARLRVDAVSLDVAVQADVADGVGVRVGVFQVRPLARFGIGKDDFGARSSSAGANGLGERVGRLDGHVDGLVAAGVSSG